MKTGGDGSGEAEVEAIWGKGGGEGGLSRSGLVEVESCMEEGW